MHRNISYYTYSQQALVWMTYENLCAIFRNSVFLRLKAGLILHRKLVKWQPCPTLKYRHSRP